MIEAKEKQPTKGRSWQRHEGLRVRQEGGVLLGVRRRQAVGAVVATAVLVAAVGLAPISLYWQTLLVEAGAFSLAVLGLVVVMGYTGLITLSQAAFMAAGAYGVALGMTELDLSFWLGGLLGLGIAAVGSAVIGLLSVRLGGHYLAMLTIAVQVLLGLFLSNSSFTGGSNGVSGIIRPSIGGVSLQGERAYLIAVSVVVGVAALSVWRMGKSRLGLAMRTVREDALAAEVVGVNTYAVRVVAFTIAGVLAAVGGIIYAGAFQFVGPDDFSINQTIVILAMGVIGGLASVVGAVVGSLLLEMLPHWLQFLGVAYLLVYGAAMIAFIASGSEGLVGIVVLAAAGVRRWLGRSVGRGGARQEAASGGGEPPGGPRGTGLVRVSGEVAAGRTQAEEVPALSVRGVSMSFGGLKALDAVSVEVRGGSVHGVLGPNGSGKSTLVNVVSGLYSPSAGGVWCEEGELTGRRPHEVARKGVSRTFQLTRVFKGLSVVENVAAGARVGAQRSDDGVSMEDLTWEALAFVGLDDVARKPAGSLPYGQQRYVELARAVAARPTVVLLDEPGAGINSAEKEVLEHLLRELCAANVGVLLIEHDVGFVRRVVDWVTVLDFGRVIAEGPPDKALEAETVRVAYLGGEPDGLPARG